MNIYNLNDRVVVEIDELEGEVILPSYAVYKYDSRNCLSKIAILTGPIEQNLKANLALKDGKYHIKIVENTEIKIYADIVQDFYVFYNTLPRIVNSFKKLSCSKNCNSCQESLELNLTKLFFEITTYLNCLDIVKDLPAFRNLSCKYADSLDLNYDNQKYYGKFAFDYKLSILELIYIFLLDLYEYNTSTIRTDESHLDIINSMFKLEELERCLRNEYVDITQLKRIVQQSKCECDE